MTERPARAPLILTGLAAGVVGGALGALLFPPLEVVTPRDSRGDSDAVQTQLARQEQRLAELEQVVEQLATLAVRSEAGPSPRDPGPVADRAQQIEQIQLLLERLDALEEAAETAETSPTGPLGSIPILQGQGARSRGAPVERIRAAQTAILSSTEAAAKLAAWRELRGLGPNAWSDPVVHEMVRVGQTHKDPGVRADVWRQADAAARHPQMRDALVLAATQDEDPGVRGEAAETLENYCDNPQVKATLEQLASGDPDPEVRENANKALRKWQERRRDEKR